MLGHTLPVHYVSNMCYRNLVLKKIFYYMHQSLQELMICKLLVRKEQQCFIFRNKIS